jgi:uncharacterized membrane protein
MADLVVIGYDNTSTAHEAMGEVERLQKDLLIQTDAMAVIVRDQDGKFKTTTNAHAVAGGAFWGMLFGLLFFVPIFGMAIGAGMGPCSARSKMRASIRNFRTVCAP